MQPDYATQFWNTVADCLERFHGFAREEASRSVGDLREEMEQIAREDGDPDMIFHEEPWYLACDLAGREDQTLLPADAAAYDAILSSHGLGPSRNSSASA